MTQPIAPSHIPAHATQAGDGVVVGDGPVRIDAFIDFQCPFCRQFELSSGPAVAALAADGLASVAYHPMNFLDQASTTYYSTRAGASSGCAADQDRFLPYMQLADIGRSVGLAEPFTMCVAEAVYVEWPPYVTARAMALGVEATPTVWVDGEPVRPEAPTITAAVTAAAASR
jgi:protein-disulfide isomerase